MSGADKSAKKQAYFAKLTELLENYTKCFIVEVDNVGSNHLQKVRIALRGKAVILMGKNTMVRKVLRGQIPSDPALEVLLPLVRGNVGFVFVKEDLAGVRSVLLKEKIGAPAKAGVIAPCDVTIPAGNTGMEPTMTSFFQALNIATKINKGQIEITNNVNIITKGVKVGASESNLLQKLGIKPFQYGLVIKSVYDNGSVFSDSILDLDEEIVAKFREGVKNIAAIGLQVGYPTVASVPHSVIRGYKNLLSIAVETTYSFKQAEKVKAYLADPSAFAAAAAPAATGKSAAPAAAVAAKVEEPVEEEDGDMGFGLFD